MAMAKHKAFIKRIILGTLMVLIVVGCFMAQLSSTPNYSHRDLTTNYKTALNEIIRQSKVEQQIPYQAGDCGISIMFATFARKNLGILRIRVVGNDSGFTYLDETHPVQDFSDNAFADFLYVDDRPEEEETLTITITSSSRKGQGITIWCTDSDTLTDYSLIVNGEEKKRDLVMRSLYLSHANTFCWPIFALMLISTVLSLFMMLKKKVKPEQAFAVIAISLGIIFCFVMTPLSIPDEQVHYQSAFKLSNYLSFQWNDLEHAPAYYFDYHGLGGHSNVSSGYVRIMNELFSRPTGEQLAMAPVYGPLGYPLMLLPQAVGITIGRLFRANFLITFYLGRLTNLLFFVGCVSLAIRKTPRFKLLFFMYGIMPMALHQAASFSYDAFINGLAVLLFAYILKAADGEGYIKTKELISIAILGAALAPAKVIYATMLLLVFIIPARRFKSLKAYWISIIAIGLCAAAIVIIFQLRGIVAVSASEGPTANWEGGVNYSIADIIQNPGRMAEVYFGSFQYRIEDWLVQAVGRLFSGHTLPVDAILARVYMLLLMLAACHSDTKWAVTAWERFLFIVSSLLPLLLVMFVMMTCWTSNTRDFIQGIQGRYLVPMIPLLCMSLNNGMVRAHKPVEKPIVLTGVFLDVMILQQILFTTFSA